MKFRSSLEGFDEAWEVSPLYSSQASSKPMHMLALIVILAFASIRGKYLFRIEKWASRIDRWYLSLGQKKIVPFVDDEILSDFKPHKN